MAYFSFTYTPEKFVGYQVLAINDFLTTGLGSRSVHPHEAVMHFPLFQISPLFQTMNGCYIIHLSVCTTGQCTCMALYVFFSLAYIMFWTVLIYALMINANAYGNEKGSTLPAELCCSF